MASFVIHSKLRQGTWKSEDDAISFAVQVLSINEKMMTTYYKIFIFFSFSVALFLIAIPPLVFAGSSDSGLNAIHLTFTINNSTRSLLISPEMRLELRWVATGATECKGSWRQLKFNPVGTQIGRITKSRSFTILCTNAKGATVTRSIVVNLIGHPQFVVQQSPQAASIAPAPVSPAPEPTYKWPDLRVLSPNGDEAWYWGENRAITWFATDVPLIREGFVIDLIDDQANIYTLPTSSVSSIARSYSWFIPNTIPEGRYKARVKIQNQSPTDTSDSFFSIIKTYSGVNKTLPCGTLGDVNGDLVISSSDIEKIRVFAANPSVSTPNEFKRADVNMDGTLTSSDSVELYLYLLGPNTTFSGCKVSGVSVDFRVNGIADIASVPTNSSINLSWTSTNAGRCLMDDMYFPPTGSIVKSVSGPSRIIYTVQCFGVGSANSASDSVAVSIEPPNKAPLITMVDVPTSFKATVANSWTVTASDPDDITLTVSVNWGDGTASTTVASTTNPGAGITTSFLHTYISPGTYTVIITAKDRRVAESSNRYLIVVTDKPRTSRKSGKYQFGAIFEGYQALRLF